MFCKKCGKEIMNEAVICPNCGCSTDVKDTSENVTLAALSIVLAVLVPIVGLVLGIVGTAKYRNEKYRNGCIIAIVLSIISWVMYALLMY